MTTLRSCFPWSDRTTDRVLGPIGVAPTAHAKPPSRFPPRPPRLRVKRFFPKSILEASPMAGRSRTIRAAASAARFLASAIAQSAASCNARRGDDRWRSLRAGDVVRYGEEAALFVHE